MSLLLRHPTKASKLAKFIALFASGAFLASACGQVDLEVLGEGTLEGITVNLRFQATSGAEVVITPSVFVREQVAGVRVSGGKHPSKPSTAH